MVQPTRDAPRTRFPAENRELARKLPGLRTELERLREFRAEQLTHLVAHERTHTARAGYGPRAHDAEADRAMQEVRVQVTAGARQALTDIERALHRMANGTFGRCRACGGDIPLAVLTAIPASALFVACHRRR